jgi:hypothetical protein
LLGHIGAYLERKLTALMSLMSIHSHHREFRRRLGTPVLAALGHNPDAN